MKEFIENYNDIFPLFEKYGFKAPMVYRELKGRDSEKVLFLVSDMYTSETQPEPSIHRSLKLKDSLKQYMNCEIMVLSPHHLNSFTLDKLKVEEIPSISLTSNLSSQELEKRLVEIFGKEWVLGKSPLASSREAKTPFWGQESVPPSSDEEVIAFVIEEAKKALQENPALSKASFAEKLGCIIARLNQCVAQLSSEGPKAK